MLHQLCSTLEQFARNYPVVFYLILMVIPSVASIRPLLIVPEYHNRQVVLASLSRKLGVKGVTLTGLTVLVTVSCLCYGCLIPLLATWIKEEVNGKAVLLYTLSLGILIFLNFLTLKRIPE